MTTTPIPSITDDLLAELGASTTEYRELNTSNYGHDDVCRLNDWSIGACELMERVDLHIRTLQAAQAPTECEAPEVVAYRYTSSQSFLRKPKKWHYQEAFPSADRRAVQDVGQLQELITLADHQRIVRSLTARLEKAEKDAARYRWLRRQPDDASAPRIDICFWQRSGDDSVNEGEGLRLEAADAAIDTAIAQEGADHE